MDAPLAHPESAGASRFGVVVTGLGVIWFLALEAVLRWPRVGVWLAFGLAALLAVWTGRWRTRERSRWSLPLAVALITFTSLGALVFASHHLAQHLMALLSAVTLTSFLDQAQHEMADELRGRLASFSLTVSLWFGWLALLSAGTFLSVDRWWLVLGGTALTTTVAVVLWLECGVAGRLWRRWLPAFAWLGAETTLVTWWLPTSVLVGSIAATTLLSLMIQSSRHIWQGAWEAGRGRRYVLVGSAIMLLVLVTARWI